MQEIGTLLVFAITSILFIFRFISQDKRIHKKVDGVENIGGIKCIQCDNDVIMKISFEKREHKWFSPSTEQPGFVLNQAYHHFLRRFFMFLFKQYLF